MMTVKEVSSLSGVSARTLHYYDEIGLLPPAAVTDAGYRMYDEASLNRLQQILLFRELQFPLKEIRRILDNPAFDRNKALEKQIRLLTMQKEHIEQLIAFAETLQTQGGNAMSFEAFDKSKLKEYEIEAKRTWGETEAYREYEQKTSAYSDEKKDAAGRGLMDIFREFGAIREKSPSGTEAQEVVRKLQRHITENYYTCTDRILQGLGQMYAAGGEMTDNIDAAGGKGTAVFAAKAIEAAFR